MSKKSIVRPILDAAASNRFKVDKRLLRSILNYLKSNITAEKLTLLPSWDTERVTHKVSAPSVAALLLQSGKYEVDGFYISKRGVQWTRYPRSHALARPYVYLSHLLRMEGSIVEMLFGPVRPNDYMLHQFEPFPKTDHGLMLARLEHYLREGTAVCPV